MLLSTAISTHAAAARGPSREMRRLQQPRQQQDELGQQRPAAATTTTTSAARRQIQEADRACFWCCHQVGGLPGFGGPGGVDPGDESRGDGWSWDHDGWDPDGGSDHDGGSPGKWGPNGPNGGGNYPPTKIYPDGYPHGKGGKGGYHHPGGSPAHAGDIHHDHGPHPPKAHPYGKGKGKSKGMGFGMGVGLASAKKTKGKATGKATTKSSGMAMYPTSGSGRRLKTRRSKHASSAASGWRKPASVDVDDEDFVMMERELNHGKFILVYYMSLSLLSSCLGGVPCSRLLYMSCM